MFSSVLPKDASGEGSGGFISPEVVCSRSVDGGIKPPPQLFQQPASSCDHHSSRPTRESDSRSGLGSDQPPEKTGTPALRASCRAFLLFAMVALLAWCTSALHARAGQRQTADDLFKQ